MIRENEELQEVLTYCLNNIKTFCGTLFPDIFSSPFSTLHDQIFELINNGHNKIAIAAPRGIGKTSIAHAVVMRSILFRLHKFILYISNSATSAELQTENIKRDLISNQTVRTIFGNIKDSLSDAVMDETFSKSAWVAYGSLFVLPRGAGQQVRGLNWNNNRPGLVIIDDLENKDEIRSEENRKKLKEWFWSDLMKTEGRYGEKTTFIYIDTIKHEDSLLVDLIDSGEWASVQLSICDENYKSYDTNYMTDEEIAAEVAEHRKLGTLDAFYMERMNIPIAKEDAIFKQEYFKYFEDLGTDLKVGDEKINCRNLLHVTIVDPAKTAKLQSADSAIITIAVDRTSRKILIRDIVSGKFYPDQLYDEMFKQISRFNSFILGYETTGLSEFIKQPVEQECRVRNLHPLLIELQAKKGVGERGKVERIATLAPHYRLGYVYHNESNCGKLEQQLLSFPRSKYWDVMDATAYITYIMDKQSVFFDPSDTVDEVVNDEFDELDNEVMLEYSLI